MQLQNTRFSCGKLGKHTTWACFCTERYSEKVKSQRYESNSPLQLQRRFQIEENRFFAQSQPVTHRHIATLSNSLLRNRAARFGQYEQRKADSRTASPSHGIRDRLWSAAHRAPDAPSCARQALGAVSDALMPEADVQNRTVACRVVLGALRLSVRLE